MSCYVALNCGGLCYVVWCRVRGVLRCVVLSCGVVCCGMLCRVVVLCRGVVM